MTNTVNKPGEGWCGGVWRGGGWCGVVNTVNKPGEGVVCGVGGVEGCVVWPTPSTSQVRGWCGGVGFFLSYVGHIQNFDLSIYLCARACQELPMHFQ